MARDEISAVSGYDIIVQNRRKTFFSGSKRTLIKNKPKPFGRNLIPLRRIAAKFSGSRSAHTLLLFAEKVEFSSEPQRLFFTVISIYPYKFSFSYLHCAQVLH